MVESIKAKRGRYSHKMKCPVCLGGGVIYTEPTIGWECWGCNGMGCNMLRTEDYNRVMGHLVSDTYLKSIQLTHRQELTAKRAKKKKR